MKYITDDVDLKQIIQNIVDAKQIAYFQGNKPKAKKLDFTIDSISKNHNI